MTKTRKCWKCHGAGSLERNAHIRNGACSACNGAGRIEYGTRRKAPSACLSIDEINDRLAKLYPQEDAR
jgi:DnaJ-class molecular chaperone